jgi:hypothetical protein
VRGWNLAFALVLWAYLLLVAPWLARRSHRRLVTSLAAGDAKGRIRQYTGSTVRNVAVAAVAVALVVTADGGQVEYLGLRSPTNAASLSASLAVGLSVVMVVRFVQVRRSGRITAVSGDEVRPYQPVTTLERAAYGVTLLVNGAAAIVVVGNQSWLTWSAIPMGALGGALSMYLFLATRSILLGVVVFGVAGAQAFIAPVTNVRSKAGRSRLDEPATPAG